MGVLLCMLSRAVHLLRCDQVRVALNGTGLVAASHGCFEMSRPLCAGLRTRPSVGECTRMHACGRMEVLLLVGCWSDRVVGSMPPGSLQSWQIERAWEVVSSLVAQLVMMQ